MTDHLSITITISHHPDHVCNSDNNRLPGMDEDSNMGPCDLGLSIRNGSQFPKKKNVSFLLFLFFAILCFYIPCTHIITTKKLMWANNSMAQSATVGL